MTGALAALQAFDAGLHPDLAVAAARACRSAADDCRSSARRLEAAADQALDGWAGRSRNQFAGVAADDASTLRQLAADYDDLAEAIDQAVRRADQEHDRLVQVWTQEQRAEAAAAREERHPDAL